MSAPSRARLDGLGLSDSCIEVLRHLWDYLDDQLTAAGTERLRAHIASCETCRGYEAFQQCFLAAVSRIRADLDAPESLRDRLAERLKEQGCGCWERARTKGA